MERIILRLGVRAECQFLRRMVVVCKTRVFPIAFAMILSAYLPSASHRRRSIYDFDRPDIALYSGRIIAGNVFAMKSRKARMRGGWYVRLAQMAKRSI